MSTERDALMSAMPRPAAIDPRGTLIALMLRFGVILALAIVIGRVVQLQVAPGEQLSSFVESRASTQSLGATRGDLLDRRGRTLATTRMGYQLIVDPEGLRKAMERDPTLFDRVVVELGTVLATTPDEFAPRMIQAIVRNEQASTQENATVSRYLKIGEVLNQEQAKKLRELKADGKLPAITIEHEPVREQTSAHLLGPIVGKVAFAPKATEKSGVLGAEKLFDDRLRGQDGSLTYVRDANGRPLWIERGAWIDANKGKDVRLSIDLEIQRIVREHLIWGMEQADAAGGRAIVINPHTGEILAMTDHLREIPDLAPVPWWDPESDTPRTRMPPLDEQPRYKVLRDDPNRAIEPSLAHNRVLEDVYEPGSTFKPFAWTLAKTRGLLPDDEVLDIKQKAIFTDYGRRVEDVYTHDDLDNWDAVIRYSSNIGMYYATSRLSFEDLRGMVKALGFGSPTGIGLGGEASGIVTSAKNWSNYTQTSIGMGYEISVTPIQMARAFSVFARHGDLAGTLPEIRLTAAGDDDRRGMLGDETIVKRVFSAEAAQRTTKPMRIVAQNMDKVMRRQYPDLPEPRYSMFGKSGTSLIAMVPPEPGLLPPAGGRAYFEKQHHSSFIVAAPADDPQIVVLVVLDDIGPERVRERRHYGSWVAGPVVRRIVEDTLPYLNVVPDIEEKPNKAD
ncbi:MAG: peptidoglycan D,D-transpeptidase FtsI family protein [Phycisphaerales bacterium JB052]